MRLLVFYFLYLFVLRECTDGAKILFFFGLSTYSHRISVWPLVERLADRGDEVTFYQPIRPKKSHPKVRDFIPFEESYQNSPEMNVLNIRLTQGRIGNVLTANALPARGVQYCDMFLSSPDTAQFLKTSKFDLIVIDSLFNECAYGLAHKFGAKAVIYGTSAVSPWWYEAFGIPAETSWIADLHLSFPHPMNFGERLISTLSPLYNYYVRAWYFYPELEELLRRKLDMPDMPPIAELERQTSLILMNTHFSEEVARSIPPFIIPIGGIHCQPAATGKQVPKNILDFINGAGDGGFIYVSFGSEVRITDAPKTIRNMFYTAFGNAKTRFVWKWDGPRPAEMPPNVLTAGWMPQQDILALQPKAFITHGGLLSIQEAITYAVPMIAVPVFAEQDYNAFRLERTGRGIKLEISTLTLPKLEGALSEILTNPTYKRNMVKASQLFKDRPRSPVDEALWWVDYILRNDNVDHLKPLAMDQFWFQRRLLDVWLFLTLILLVALLLIFYSIKSIFKLVFYILSLSQTSNKKAPQGGKGQKAKKS